jgi:SNF2 family DNA or RNA helicase
VLTLPLHEYQEPPVDQLLGRGNLLVAFAMGLGKTPIGIACAEELLGCGDIDLCLIVCESSLKYQWAQAIAKFTDIPARKIRLKLDGKTQEITVPADPHGVIIDGRPFQRNKVRYSAADDRKRQYKHSVTRKTDYVIISYDNVCDDARWVRQLRAGLVILDEATAIKTFSAERTQKIKRVLTAPYRLALTGTPVDNRAEELFSIMEWVDPEVLGRWDLFEAAYIVRNDYGRVVRYKHLDVLHEKVAPAIARVSHDDPKVQGFIPKAVVAELPVEPSPALYSAFLDVAADLLDGLRSIKRRGGFDVAAYYAGQPDENTAAGMVMSMLMAVDLLLAHPDLLVVSAEAYADSARRRELGEERAVWPGSKYAWTKWQEGLVDDLWDAPKLDKLAKRVPQILAEDPEFKVLVYTRQPKMLPYIQETLGLPCVQYHGGMNPRAKAAAQARFTNDPKTRVFLSSYAGARGTDLYTASHLINYDIPWAAGMADQINGRHVRASSKFKRVWIENMITTGTTEEWKRDNLLFKRRVGSAILDGHGADRHGGVENEAQSLTAFLTSIVGDA